MNGVLFVALLVIWQEKSGGGDPTVLPQASAANATDPTTTDSTDITPTLSAQGNRPRLNYEQWVALLGQERATMAAKNPDHLTLPKAKHFNVLDDTQCLKLHRNRNKRPLASGLSLFDLFRALEFGDAFAKGSGGGWFWQN